LRRLLLIFKNDVKRRLKSPMSILVLLLIPVMMTGLVGMIFAPSDSSQQQLPKIKVLVVDKDKNMASKFLLGAFDAQQLKEMFQVTVVDEKEGHKLIKRGKASALVIIPEDFSKRLLNAEQTELLVIKNPVEQFLPQVVEEFMVTFGIVISGIVQIFEPELKLVRSLTDLSFENISITQMTPILENSKQKIVTLKQYLSPLLLSIKSLTVSPKQEPLKEPQKKSVLNIFELVMPGMAVMFLLFIIEIFMRDILTEREDGKLQRIMFSPIRTIELILARIFSGWFMGLIVCFVMILLGTLLFGISWGNYGYLVVFCAITCFWIAAFFALLNAFFKNKNQAGALTSPIILVFSAFGGSMMPVNQLPQAMRWVSDFTLNQWYIKGVQQVNAGAFPTLPASILLVTGLILFMAAAHFLKKRIAV